MIVTDQAEFDVNLPDDPMRIISLVPSQTELLFDLGLDDRIIGVTKFCEHPADKVKNKKMIGGTKNLKLDLINELQPDLIIGNLEENQKHHIEELKRDYPVWISDVRDLESAQIMISEIGRITNSSDKAEKINISINSVFSSLDKRILEKGLLDKKVAYFIWEKPMMVVGRDNFINSMLNRIGLRNVFEKYNVTENNSGTERYPEITEDELINADPDLVFLSSEPYPYKDTHIEKYQNLVPKSDVLPVRGDMFSWYGSRLIKSAQYFINLFSEIQQ